MSTLLVDVARAAFDAAYPQTNDRPDWSLPTVRQTWTDVALALLTLRDDGLQVVVQGEEQIDALPYGATVQAFNGATFHRIVPARGKPAWASASPEARALLTSEELAGWGPLTVLGPARPPAVDAEGTWEYGYQFRTTIGGAFDRTVLAKTLEEAESDVARLLEGQLRDRGDGHGPNARVITRFVGAARPVEDGAVPR